MGKLGGETIKSLKANADAARAETNERIWQWAKELEAERLRQAKIRGHIAELNQQIDADPELQRALDIELRKHPHKRDFQNCSGIPIAINIDQIAVFSPYGIKFLQLKNGMKFIGGSWARVDFDVPLTLD